MSVYVCDMNLCFGVHFFQHPGRAGDGLGQIEEWGAGEQSVVLAVQVGIFPVVPALGRTALLIVGVAS